MECIIRQECRKILVHGHHWSGHGFSWISTRLTGSFVLRFYPLFLLKHARHVTAVGKLRETFVFSVGPLLDARKVGEMCSSSMGQLLDAKDTREICILPMRSLLVAEETKRNDCFLFDADCLRYRPYRKLARASKDCFLQ